MTRRRTMMWLAATMLSACAPEPLEVTLLAPGDGDTPGDMSADCGNGRPDFGEVCDDGNTDDCDGCSADCATEETEQLWYPDVDGDSYGDATAAGVSGFCAPSGLPVHRLDNNDCNDGEALESPGLLEICGNGLDDNCDGADLSCGGDLLTYDFNGGSATDSSGNGLDGVVNGTVSFVPGRYGLGLSTTGDGRVTINNAGSLYTGRDVTIELWLKRNPGAEGVIFGDSNWTGAMVEGEYELRVHPGGAVSFGAGGGCPGDLPTVQSDLTVLLENIWTYLAVTWNGDEVRFYLDGQHVDSKPFDTANCPRSHDYHLGGRGGAVYMSGIYDELRMSSVPRSPEEIAATMRRDSTQ